MEKLKSFFYLAIFWVLAVWIYLLIGHYGTNLTVDWASTNFDLIFWGAVGGLLLAIMDEISILIMDRPKFRRRTYGFAIIFRVLFVLLAVLFIVLLSRLAAFFSGSIEFSQILPSFFSTLTHKRVHPFLFYVFLVSGLFSFIRQMIFMIGKRVLINLLLGKYHHPKDEERIFMFLDLRGSTTHAERMGHSLFSQLIQDCFHDLTDSVILYKVEIYKYVGDEVILTWTTHDGIQDANCISVYFHFQQHLNKRANYYQEKYGLVPEFKAGVNYGMVTVVEIGDIKRDVTYLSDVLNAAARIQEKCNEFKKNILISKDLLDILPSNTKYTYNNLGTISLLGKQELTEIYSVESPTS